MISRIREKVKRILFDKPITPVATLDHVGCLVAHASSICNVRNVGWKPECRLTVGERTQVLGRVAFDREGASVTIGSRSFVNAFIVCAQEVTVGDDVLIAWDTTIVDHNSHSLIFSQRCGDAVDWLDGRKDWSHVAIAPVHICDKVWVGFGAKILKGVTVGEGAIIGAGAVVTKDVAPWTIVAGNPATVVRAIPESER